MPLPQCCYPWLRTVLRSLSDQQCAFLIRGRFSMRVQQPVRDRNMSLWQSAVRQTLVNRIDLPDSDKKQAEYGVSLPAQSDKTGKPLVEAAPPQGAGQSPIGSSSNIAQASKAAFDALQAHQNNDTAAHGTLFST